MKKPILATMAICFFTATNATAQKNNADYFLSVVTATVKTGKENKEYPSSVSIAVYCGNAKYSNHRGFLLYGYQNELAKYSTMPLVIGNSHHKKIWCKGKFPASIQAIGS